HGVEPIDAGRGRRDRAHDARVARNVEIVAVAVAQARQSHRGRKIFDTPRDGDGAHARARDLTDVQQALGRLRGDEDESGAADGHAVLPFESVEVRVDLADVCRAPGLRDDVAARPARDAL